VWNAGEEERIAVCVPPHNPARKTDPTCPGKNISADVKKFTGFNFPETYAFALVIKPVYAGPAGPGPAPRDIFRRKIEIYAKRT